ncbi:MAG: hypothetical protein ACKO96_46045, partial [Flammeovirgaceae bacterium]
SIHWPSPSGPRSRMELVIFRSSKEVFLGREALRKPTKPHVDLYYSLMERSVCHKFTPDGKY